MAVGYYLLGGVQLRPLQANESEILRIGTVLEADNGSRTLVHRAYKRGWTLRHTNASESIRAVWRTRYLVAAQQAFVTPTEESYTVIVTEFRDPMIRFGSDRIPWYALELVLLEV